MSARTALFASCGILLTACASTPDPQPPDPPPAPLDTPKTQHVAPDLKRSPPRPRPFAELARCNAEVSLVSAKPVRFEGDIVADLSDVEVRVVAPVGTVVEVTGSALEVDFARVSLPPKVALRLPAGPAADAPAGSSGDFFDLGSLAAVGLANLFLLPVTVPLMLVTGKDMFFLEAPTFSEGMFADVVLDEASWNTEVARRAAPHKEALAEEAQRQARFAAWRAERRLSEQLRSCTVDLDGTCTVALWWPTPSLTFAFGGACGPPPPPAPPVAEPTMPPPMPTPEQVTAWLPPLPPPPQPFLLDSPPRPADDVRGEGALQTRRAWQRSGARMAVGAEARLGPASASRQRTPLSSVDDGTLTCRLESRTKDWDIDGSSPELRVRLAWGFDDDTIGMTFPDVAAWKMDFRVGHVALRRGEFIKVSVVDVDALVDDWGGMALTRWDGQRTIRLRHASFQVQCDIDVGELSL